MKKIELIDISKSFNGQKVLRYINLSVKEGEFLSLLGPSGSGKSTLLKIIAGIHKIEAGDILVDGKSIKEVPINKRGTVIVFQESLLFPHLNLEENIGFGLKMAGVNKKVRTEKVQEIVELLKLQGCEKKYSDELSGGQRQRASIGRALAVNPSLLLLDEPFSSLDITLRQEMRELIRKLHQKLYITTILVTHDKEEAFMLSDRIALLLNGSINQCDTPQRIYERPESLEAADFLGEKNYIEGTIEDSVFNCCLGSFNIGDNYEVLGKGSAHYRGEVTAMLHREHIHISKEKLPDSIEGVISSLRYAGDRSYYSITAKDIELKGFTSDTNFSQINSLVSVVLDFSKAVFYAR
ncbi:ABC transporter ATP-binding protein [Clostridium sp. YIM B02515]|uniref:ABC transporter ATP-binding protein n=1 Tax=Clostridium rhizosphaerae TaxID=2803861 RepID=A0ABS1T4V0_9CLOT|nr:ABC transporter ATP-binding protein [Clostridium rhizosphaerae]MBL4934286.1 ABC transporter ATP-binding protein [Clostridium rhizosphaerae]